MLWKIAGGIAVFLFVITAGWLLRMEAAQRSSGSVRVPPEKAMEVYLGLRNQALSSSARQGQTAGIRPDDPRAVLMDVNTTTRIATIAAFADGTASIYISNGGGLLGGGQAYPSVHDAGQKLIAVARKLQPTMQKTQQYPLPEKGEVIFYVVTGNGVYTVRALQSECTKRTHPLYELFAAGDDVITQYRLNSQKPR
jgi:hypothetical protein